MLIQNAQVKALSPALESNDAAALALALLLLPSQSFTEYELWEQIAGLSYAGDPRMAVPGAENPEKVKNIVRGEGALQGFRDKYGTAMMRLGVHQEKGTSGLSGAIQWQGQGETVLEVSQDLFREMSGSFCEWQRSDSLETVKACVDLLPLTFHARLSSKFIKGGKDAEKGSRAFSDDMTRLLEIPSFRQDLLSGG